MNRHVATRLLLFSDHVTDIQKGNDKEEESPIGTRTRRSLSKPDGKSIKQNDPRMENDDGEVTIIDLGRDDVFVGKDCWDWDDDGEFDKLRIAL